MYVYERMNSNPICAELDSTASQALKLMEDTGHSYLPVVSREGKLAGFVSERQLAQISPSKSIHLTGVAISAILNKIKVKDVMDMGIYCINKDALIEKAVLMIKDNHIDILPVVDDDGCVIGIITRFDIIKAFIDLLGVKKDGTHIAIRIKEGSDMLSDIEAVAKKHNTDIRSLSFFTEKGHNELIIKVLSLNTDELIADIEKAGYEIISADKQR